MFRTLICVLALLGALLVGGCGESRTAPPDVVTPVAPAGTVNAAYPKVGLRFRAPANWQRRPGLSTLVAVLVSGRATIAVWRYPRTEPLPVSRSDLGGAKARLVDAIKQQDSSARVRSAKILKIDGRDAIAIVATESLAGQAREARSTHFFANGAEYVVDAYAPPQDFKTVDRSVFAPLARSVRIAKTGG